jgi:hypothetical protein
MPKSIPVLNSILQYFAPLYTSLKIPCIRRQDKQLKLPTFEKGTT